MRLASAHLGALPDHVRKPSYDREARGAGIVHFGIGAFHRAHMAAYTDEAMAADDGDWRIIGVSLRSPAAAQALNPQDGLYSLVDRSAAGSSVRLVGAIQNVLVASGGAETIASQIVPPQRSIVSFTITEKGYCRTPDGSLDLATAAQGSFYPILASAFRQRMAAGHGGITLLSCDNLAHNGAQLKRLILEYLDARAPGVTEWFMSNCTCPSTMVDRIVPAATDTDRNEIEALLGLRDDAVVVTEPFSQWVIEDDFAGPRPAWQDHGAQLTSDVRAYEDAKLRMLNGAHSALAYCGLQRGHEFVHQAIGDRALASLIDRLMRAEAATSLTPTPGQDLHAYADALIDRFTNPALNHRLNQIAMDGSQKIPQRWLETLAHHQRQGKRCPAILTAIAAWLRHIRGGNGPVDDPLAEHLARLAARTDIPELISGLFGAEGLLASDWQPDTEDRAIIIAAVQQGI